MNKLTNIVKLNNCRFFFLFFFLHLPKQEEAPEPKLSMMQAARPETAGAYRAAPSADELYHRGQEQIVSMSRPNTASDIAGGKRPIFGSTGAAQKYVYRSGFKMPKVGLMSSSHLSIDNTFPAL